MKFQIFTIKIFLRWTLIILASRLLAWILLSKKDENHYPQEVLKEWKYIEEKVGKHIIDALGSSSDDSDDYDEK